MKICSVFSAMILSGCAGSYIPPVSVSAGFFGATVTVSEPGFTVPAKVVTSPAVVTPTLIVPDTLPKTTGALPITNAAGETVHVPVAPGPVTEPVLLIPAK